MTIAIKHNTGLFRCRPYNQCYCFKSYLLSLYIETTLLLHRWRHHSRYTPRFHGSSSEEQSLGISASSSLGLEREASVLVSTSYGYRHTLRIHDSSWEHGSCSMDGPGMIHDRSPSPYLLLSCVWGSNSQ